MLRKLALSPTVVKASNPSRLVRSLRSCISRVEPIVARDLNPSKFSNTPLDKVNLPVTVCKEVKSIACRTLLFETVNVVTSSKTGTEILSKDVQ